MAEISAKVARPATWLFVLYMALFILLKSTGMDYEEWLYFVPIMLGITFLSLLYFQKHWNLRIIFYLIFTTAVLYAILVFGRRTGLVFGPIVYGRTLGPGWFFDVPYFAPCFWLIIIYSLGVMVKNTKYTIWIQAVFAAFLLVMFDTLLEPVAMKFHMWGWDRRKIPFFNSVAWFAISYPFFVLLLSLKAKLRNDLAPYIFLIMTLFFLFSNLIYYEK